MVGNAVTTMRRWERACHGDGQLAAIVGEPGLGKSRLIEPSHSLQDLDPSFCWPHYGCCGAEKSHVE